MGRYLDVPWEGRLVDNKRKDMEQSEGSPRKKPLPMFFVSGGVSSFSADHPCKKCTFCANNLNFPRLPSTAHFTRPRTPMTVPLPRNTPA
eukprot:1178066-Prorocentrum_minimum.AAC.3